jgi:23S rRNA (uracil1939-C5)-methyltransferase
MQPRQGPPRLVQIEKPIYGGAFLARDEGKATFVPLALPGEQVHVRVTEEKRGYAAAEVEELVTRSAQRVEPGCIHFGVCGGCHYQHAAYAAQLALKQEVLRETLVRGGVAVPNAVDVLAGEPWSYRNRIRLAFDGAGNFGYRARRSHEVVAISECPIAAPLLLRAAQAAAGIARQFGAALRPTEMALFCDARQSALLLTLFVAGPSKAQFDEFAAAVRELIPELAGAELVVEGQAGRPSRTLAQWGSVSLSYRAAGFDYRVDHDAFFQVNRWLVDALVERVADGYSGALAWDLFAGVGLFARRLASSFEKVVAVEAAPTATQALAVNLRETTGVAERASTLDFLRRNRKGEHPGLIVVDPPRTGLGAEITQLLVEIAPAALTYVSCDPATLARDLRALLAQGFAMESVTLVDLFPQTFHLETVVQLRRS